VAAVPALHRLARAQRREVLVMSALRAHEGPPASASPTVLRRTAPRCRIAQDNQANADPSETR
jgi:hypothetical protein